MVSSRRHFLAAAGLAGLGAAGLAGLAARGFWPDQGMLNPCLGALPPELARHPLVGEAWAGLDPVVVWDSHAHLLGVGADGNAKQASYDDAHGMLRWPLTAAQRYIFLNAACIDGAPAVERAYVARLRALRLGAVEGGRRTAAANS